MSTSTAAGSIGAASVFAASRRRSTLRRLTKQRLGLFFAAVLALILIAAIFASAVAPYRPAEFASMPFRHPSASFLLGTDQLGRDVLSRIIYGARISLLAGILSVFLSLVIGVPLGIVSAYFGGSFDIVMQRIIDVAVSLPALVLALVLVAVLGPGLRNVIIAIGVVQGPRVSRIIRSSVLVIEREAYIDAARATGGGSAWIMLRHVLPNTLPIVLTVGSSLVGLAIVVEASLSFLGMGIQPPTASWGEMLSTSGQQYFIIDPWLSMPPGIAIVITVLSFNMLGDAIQQFVDPRLRGRR
jgi:ABC-type dipeptide/oligopeptide/nickel transport system permease subunit